jgi:cytochrome b6-f complex iron-sulfur subunit
MKSTELEHQTSRREFIRNLGIWGSYFVAAGFFIRNVLRYLLPERKVKSYHKYLVSKVDELPVGFAKKITLGGAPVFVVHTEDGYRVFSGVCTHLGCVIRWEAHNNRFYCPCHKGVFSSSGEVLDGPPPAPLKAFKVSQEKNLVFVYVEDKMGGPWA